MIGEPVEYSSSSADVLVVPLKQGTNVEEYQQGDSVFFQASVFLWIHLHQQSQRLNTLIDGESKIFDHFIELSHEPLLFP